MYLRQYDAQRAAFAMRAARVNQHAAAVAAAVENILAADAFDSAAVAALAKRDAFPDAIRHLSQIARPNRRFCNGVLPVLLETTNNKNVLPFRIGFEFKLFHWKGESRARPRITTETVQQKLTSRNASTRHKAAMVLALLGELPKWRTAKRELRAAFCLAAVVRHFREGAP